MDGVLVIDKPKGLTSHDVVERVKRRLRADRTGHLGTLDPVATGVLPLVINRATRYARFLEGVEKDYLVEMMLGEERDTYDIEGRTIKRCDTGGITPDDVKRVLESFRGRIRQIPPMFSSVKKKGVPLYRLARKGIEVEREPKEVEIYGIDLLGVDIPGVRFRVRCSRGTYVRVLCHDAGRMLGCGAYLKELRRLRSGQFTIDQAVELSVEDSILREAIKPLKDVLNTAFMGLRAIDVDERDALRIRHGNPAIDKSGVFSALKDGELVRFVHRGNIIALGRYIKQRGMTLERVFPL